MKKHIVWFSFLIALILVTSVAMSSDKPRPFNFEVGTSSYQNCLDIIKANNWRFQEYEKRQFKEIGNENPERGKNTFVIAKLKNMKGARSIRLFFNSDRVLDAVIIVLDPKMFPVAMDDLNGKYDLVKKNLLGQNFTDNYTHVLWQKSNVYIELQKIGEHLVRVLYVEKLLHENYKDFFFKPYENFQKPEGKPEWMKNL